MRMGVDYRIDTSNGFAKALGSKVRWGIHLDDQFRRSDLDRAPKPFVPRVHGGAYMALAANHRNSMRRAGAKERNFDLPHCDPFMA